MFYIAAVLFLHLIRKVLCCKKRFSVKNVRSEYEDKKRSFDLPVGGVFI